MHVSVVAVLTLLVNAPTTGPLLGALGMLQTPREQERALEDPLTRTLVLTLTQTQTQTPTPTLTPTPTPTPTLTPTQPQP